MEVLTVRLRKDGIKYCIIPKSSDIKSGDRILITNNLRLINKFMEEENVRGKERRKEGI